MYKKEFEDEIINFIEEIRNHPDRINMLKTKENIIETFADMNMISNLIVSDYPTLFIVKRSSFFLKNKNKTLLKKEMIDIVQKILLGDEEEWLLDSYLDVLQYSITDPRLSDYIFWNEGEMTASEIIEKALAYKPIDM